MYYADLLRGILVATALQRGITLVTRNMKDFAGLDIQRINTWET